MADPISTFLVKKLAFTKLAASITAHVIVAAGSMVGANLLAPKNRFGQVNDRNSLTVRGANSLGATTSRQYIYGEVKVGGTIVYMGTSDDDPNDNRYLHMVLVHCDHETEELGDLYVNGEIVNFSAYVSDGALRSATGTRYSGSLWIADHHGGPSQTVNSTLDAAMGNWGSNDTLSGMSYTYIRMYLKDGEDNAFPTGIPQFQRVVKGRKVYDPREVSHDPDDSTTWEYSANWALCVADYLQSEFGYGRFGLGHDRINETELIASANNSDETVNSKWDNWSASEEVSVNTQRLITEGAILYCTTAGTTGTSEPAGPYSGGETNITDGTAVWRVLYADSQDTENRYELNGIVNSDEDPMEVIRSMRTAADGLVEYIGGEWFIRSGRYITPTITLSESDFAGPIAGTTKDDRTVSINTVKGVVVNKWDDYNVIDAPAYSNSTYVDQDNGIVSTRELELLFTNSPSAAQRLFKIALAKARQQISHKATFTAKAMQLQVGDNFKLDFDKYGYSSTATPATTFQVWSHQLKIGGDGELLVEMEFREISSNTYDWTATTDQETVDPAPTAFLPDPFTVSAPSGFSVSSGTDQLIEASDGTILPTVLVTWTAAADVNVTGYQLRWKYSNLSTDTNYRYFTINGRNNTSLVITGVRESRGNSDQYIDIDIRSLTPVKEGEWTIVEYDHDVIGKSAAPSTPTGPGTGSKPEVTPIVEGLKIEMDEGKLSDLDFFNYHIWVKTTNSPPTQDATTTLYSEVATTSTSGTTKTITDLTAGQNYYVWVAAMDGGRRFSSLTEATPFPAVPATNFLDVSTQTLGVQIEVGQSGVPTDWSDYDMSVGLYVEGATATYVSSTPTSSGEFTITAESATPSGWTMLSSGSYPTVGIRGRPNSYGDFQLNKTYTIDYMDARGVIHELQIVRQWHIVQRYVLGPPRFNPITLPAKGGSGLGFKLNYLNASTANDGEIFVAGTTFTNPTGTTTTGITENYVGTPYEGGISPLTGSIGDFWLMWTATAANTRFSPLTFTHQNVVPIRESSSGGYEVFNNVGTGQAITFASTDVLLAACWRDDSTTGITGIEEYVDKNPGQSKNYSAGVSGYKIDAETGDAEFNDVTIRGDLLAGTIDIGTDAFQVKSDGHVSIGMDEETDGTISSGAAHINSGDGLQLFAYAGDSGTSQSGIEYKNASGTKASKLAAATGTNNSSTFRVWDGSNWKFAGKSGFRTNEAGSTSNSNVYSNYQIQTVNSSGSTTDFIFEDDKLWFRGTGSGPQDTNLYRDSANVLKTDDSLIVDGNFTANDLDLRSQMSSLRAHANVSGGGILTYTTTGYFKWSSRFIVMANGDGDYFSTNGYFDIYCPTSGTITGVGGASNKTATSDGIPLSTWEALYYILPIGSSNATVAANFRVCRYNSDVEIPANWLLLAVRNADTSNAQVHVLNRYQLKVEGSNYSLNTGENLHSGRGNISDGSHTTGSAGYWPGYHNRTYGHEIEAASDGSGSTLHIARETGAVLNIGADANADLVYFRNTNSSSSGVATAVGSISITSSSTAFNTSSDYRLKENVVSITDGIHRLKQLNPSRFNFKIDPDVTVDGFLAHEVSDIVPESISGTKDGMMDEEYEISPAVYDDDGELVSERVMGTRSVPDYQGIDQSKLVPLLTAALQEAVAKIEALEARVAALEG